jgi:hypothetical protein
VKTRKKPLRRPFKKQTFMWNRGLEKRENREHFFHNFHRKMERKRDIFGSEVIK